MPVTGGRAWALEQLGTALIRTYGPHKSFGWVTKRTPVLMGHGRRVTAGRYVSDFTHWGFDSRSRTFMQKVGGKRVTVKFPKRSKFKGVDRKGRPLTAAELRQRRNAARSAGRGRKGRKRGRGRMRSIPRWSELR